MTLTTEKNGTQLTVHLSGELNTLTAPELSALLTKELGGVEALTLDFAECDYVSSAGLRVLLATFKQMAGFLRIPGGKDVLENTGLDAVFGM